MVETAKVLVELHFQKVTDRLIRISDDSDMMALP
jgi:hypothetical protein